MNVNVNFNNPNFNNQQQQPQPQYRQLAVGQGISQQEYNTIVQSCTQIYQQRQMPYSTNSGRAIKQQLGGEWLVISSNVNNKKFDFSLTSVSGGDFMSFTLDVTQFQVCRLV
jgi:hypothetical protein